MYSKLKNYSANLILLNRKKVFLLIILFGIILLCTSKWFFSDKKPTKKKPLPSVETAVVKQQDIRQTAELLGTIRAKQATTLIAKSRGMLDILITAGQKVKKGDLIAKIEKRDLEQNRSLSKEAEQIAKLQYDRIMQLFKSGVASKSLVEEKKNSWIEAKKRLSESNLAVDQIHIVAPFDGIIGVFKMREGSEVREGDVIVNIYDPSTLMVEFDVPIDAVAQVNNNASVLINKRTYPLTHIQRMVDEETHMSPAYVDIECANCLVGTSIDISLVLNEKKSVITIPYSSILLLDGHFFVYIIKEQRAVLTPIKLGIREKGLVEVISGLNIGDVLITYGQARLYSGAPVKTSSSTKTNSQK